jgi:hypothetical protein
MLPDKIQEAQEFAHQANSMLSVISTQIQVTSAAEEAQARAVFAELRDKAKTQEKKYDTFLVPLRNGMKALRDMCKESVAPLYTAADLVSKRVGDYREQIVAEQRRLEAEAQTLAEQGQIEKAIEIVQQANEEIAPEKVKGAGITEALEVTVLDHHALLLALAGRVVAGEKLRPDMKRALLAWAKAEAKRGVTLPGVDVRTIAKLQHK